MLRRTVAILVLASAMPSLVCAAEPVTLSNAGYWQAYVVTSDQGTPLCGITTRLDDNKTFYIKWFKGSSYLTVQAFKVGWAIPPGVEAQIALRVPGGTPWSAKTTKPAKTESFVEFYIPRDVVKPFTHDFTAAPVMLLEFATGNEQPWTLNLAGSTQAITALVKCIEYVAGPNDVTQPYAYARQTQPFAPPATQPFTADTQPLPSPGTQPFSSQAHNPKHFDQPPDDE